MTIIIGIKCDDCVVIGSDSSATSVSATQHPIIEKPIEKIIKIDNLLVAGSGSIGINQRFIQIIKDHYKSITTKNKINACKELTKLLTEDLDYTHYYPLNNNKLNYTAIVAFESITGLTLCEFSGNGFQPELKEDNNRYVSIGSGQLLADPFLRFIDRVMWRNNKPNMKMAILSALWTLNHVIDSNPGGINGPPKISVLDITAEDKIKQYSEDDLMEFNEAIDNYEETLYRIMHGETTEESDEIGIPEP